jgi:hypothetical protein
MLKDRDTTGEVTETSRGLSYTKNTCKKGEEKESEE